MTFGGPPDITLNTRLTHRNSSPSPICQHQSFHLTCQMSFLHQIKFELQRLNSSRISPHPWWLASFSLQHNIQSGYILPPYLIELPSVARRTPSADLSTITLAEAISLDWVSSFTSLFFQTFVSSTSFSRPLIFLCTLTAYILFSLSAHNVHFLLPSIHLP